MCLFWFRLTLFAILDFEHVSIHDWQIRKIRARGITPNMQPHIAITTTTTTYAITASCNQQLLPLPVHDVIYINQHFEVKTNFTIVIQPTTSCFTSGEFNVRLYYWHVALSDLAQSLVPWAVAHDANDDDDDDTSVYAILLLRKRQRNYGKKIN